MDGTVTGAGQPPAQYTSVPIVLYICEEVTKEDKDSFAYPELLAPP